jgi:hypothetical protein
MFIIDWTELADITYDEELDFILYKRNDFEVLKFALLVDDFLDTLSNNPTIGQFKNDKNIYSVVISKQTTLFYKIIEPELKIELLLFWNNSQNPSHLDKLLK